MSPAILDPEWLCNLRERGLRWQAIERFGELEEAETLPAPDGLEGLREALHPSARPEWRRALAAEAAFRQSARGDVDPAWRDWLGETSPFDSPSPLLRDLWGCGIAVATIPLDAGQGGAAAQMWLVEDAEDRLGRDHRALWSGADAWLAQKQPGLKLFSVRSLGSSEIVVGRSWQLSASLALKALEAGQTRELARRWIVTGECPGELVQPVLLGVKLQLNTLRRWLLHPRNQGEITEENHPRGGMVTAATLDLAWKRVTDSTDYAQGQDATWPERVNLLHAFTSQAYRVVIASILLSRARRVLLWTSEPKPGKDDNVSQQATEAIQSILAALKERGVIDWELQVETPAIPSGDIVEAERALLNGPLVTPADPGPVLFNLTCGNALMKFAALNVARRDARLWIVYRDRDMDGSLDLILLRQDGAQSTSGRMRFVPQTLPVNWSILIEDRSAPAAPGKEVESWENLLAKILAV